MQKVVELLRLDTQHRLLIGDQPLLDHINGHLHRRLGGALAVAGLQHEELALFDGELDILHVPVMLLQGLLDLHQLGVALGEHLLHRREGAVAAGLVDRLRGASAGHHVLPLGIDQELAEEDILAGGGIAGKGDAGGAVFAHVAENHRLDIDRGPPVGGDVVELAVGDGAGVHPGTENSTDRPPELLLGILREVTAKLFLDLVLEQADQLLEVVGGEIGVALHAALLLHLFEEVLENVAVEVEHDVGIHLDEAPIGVIGEAGVTALLDHSLDRLIVEAEVEDGVHHPRHRGAGAGAHRDEKWVLRVAELLPHHLLDALQVLIHLRLEFGGVLAVILVEFDADLGGNSEPRRHRQADGGHLRQVGPFAAEQVLHLPFAFGLAGTEEIHILGTHQLLLLRTL